MANPQLYPLEVNSSTGEPFLRLRSHKQIIITPPRPEDVALYPAIMNDPRIYEWLGSPPFPYTTEHAEEWYQKTKALSDGALESLNAARDTPDPILLDVCPIRNIRELKEDGSDVFLGDIGIFRVTDGKFLIPHDEDINEEAKTKYKAANDALPLGDPKIAWTIGCKWLQPSLHSLSLIVADYIIPSSHGRGIMTDALQTLMWDWAIPRMGVRHIIGSAFQGNTGSLRVFEKSGFVPSKFFENHAQTRDQWRNLHVVEWKQS
ncbi:hypothetical protein C0992_008347 [Termitomyces sp. T32_za158]|nr:hypothetical protein C0992_008347 [Termitomyces sp. T32_za158]